MSHALSAGQVGKVTWADYIALPDDDRRELIDGVLVEVEVPTYLHEHIIGQLIGLLFVWSQTHGGSILGSGYKVRISADRAFMPDLQFYRVEKVAMAARQQQGLAEGRPDLVVEVISPSSQGRDRLLKLEGYASIGVPEYWIVEPEGRLIERFCLVDGTYRAAGGAMGDAVFAPESFEGFEVPLGSLWLDELAGG